MQESSHMSLLEHTNNIARKHTALNVMLKTALHRTKFDTVSPNDIDEHAVQCLVLRNNKSQSTCKKALKRLHQTPFTLSPNFNGPIKSYYSKLLEYICDHRVIEGTKLISEKYGVTTTELNHVFHGLAETYPSFQGSPEQTDVTLDEIISSLDNMVLHPKQTGELDLAITNLIQVLQSHGRRFRTVPYTYAEEIGKAGIILEKLYNLYFDGTLNIVSMREEIQQMFSGKVSRWPEYMINRYYTVLPLIAKKIEEMEYLKKEAPLYTEFRKSFGK